jgi:cellulose synthase/poly-beta-1,6-N-acetylglucosamine synthase-like glycosyltransferase
MPIADRERACYAARARVLGLPFVTRIPAECRIVEPGATAAIGPSRAALSTVGERLAFFAPTAETIKTLRTFLSTRPDEARRIRITTPSAIRSALRDARARALLKGVLGRLNVIDPLLSARQVATAGQIATAMLVLIVSVLAMLLVPETALFTLNLIGAPLFFGVSMLRFVAAGRVRPMVKPPEIWRGDEDLPIYTILVPLRGEAGVVGELIAALRQIDWPIDRLDIKLIVEADDEITRATVERAAGGPPFTIVVVPVAEPRTKPKGLAFALPLARGQFVTVYDAEDRPHPQQLREAYAAFRKAGPNLACLQAPLLIDREQEQTIARFFALEYSALFDGLLPALADLGLPLPLGGTSNHFRRAALERVGGWDPFNVTEDADLGIRLARFGYRSGTLRLPTIEEAPSTTGAWMRQRTRWFKGWLQTWLVHTRRPVLLARQIGAWQLTGFTLVGIGMIVSAIVHPVYLATILMLVTDPFLPWSDGSVSGAAIIGIDLFNLAAGYLAMGLLASRTLALRRGRIEPRLLLMLPLYWLLMSVAGYRAIGQLILRPHHWEKTPHRGRRLMRRSSPARRKAATSEIGQVAISVRD